MTNDIRLLNLGAHYDGTCQACFAVQSVIKGKMVNHGYERPGTGHIHGTCVGTGALPYELSCELTKSFRESSGRHIVSLKKRIADLRADTVEDFRYSDTEKRRIIAGGVTHETLQAEGFYPVRRSGRWGGVSHYEKTTIITVTRDSALSEEQARRIGYSFTKPGLMFVWMRTNALSSAEIELRSEETHFEFLTKKVTEWKYAPEALREYGTSKQKTVFHLANAKYPQKAMCTLSRSGYRAIAATPQQVTCSRCKKHLDRLAAKK